MPREKVTIDEIEKMNPLLISEWDKEKNHPLLITDLSSGSHKKVWWKCSVCQSEWQADFSNRLRGTGCPFCAGRLVKTGVNDFASNYPNLLEEWDYELNGTIDPALQSMRSGKKVWWKCKRCGHNWQATIENRTFSNTGCPKCSRYKHTSFAEQALYFYVKKLFPDTENSMHFDWLGRREIDVFIPSVNLAIEYDGVHWHKQVAKDDKKNQVLIEHGISVIRIREQGCPHITSAEVIETESPSSSRLYYQNALSQLLLVLSERYEVSLDFDINIDRDRMAILSLYSGSEEAHSFKTLFPEESEEWNYELNEGLSPDQVSAYSNQKVWWTCKKCGNTWEQRIVSRAYGSGCSICAKEKQKVSYRNTILSSRGSFAKLHPELLKEWNYEKNIEIADPEKITAGTLLAVWWKCPACGNEWQASVARRTSGIGCPKCGKKKAAENRLLTLLDGGKNSFGQLHPELICEFNTERNPQTNLYEILPNSKRTYWWKCSKCHFEWQTSILNRSNGSNCPECAKKENAEKTRERAYVKGQTDLLTLYPELCNEWIYERNELSPARISPNSSAKVWWRCKDCGFEWQTTIYNRAINKTGCPNCSHKKAGEISQSRGLIRGTNDLKTMNPSLCEEWDYQLNDKRPEDYLANSGVKVWWKCRKCNNSWQARIANRSTLKSGCPYCSNRKLLVGFNDLKSKRPDLVAEFSEKNGDIHPEDIIFTSKKKYWWKCRKCGYEWESSVSTRLTCGCKKCSKRRSDETKRIKLIAERGSLADNYPYLAKEWHPTKNDPVTPQDVLSQSDAKVWWLCSICGFEWEDTIGNRVRGTGCPKCSRRQKID